MVWPKRAASIGPLELRKPTALPSVRGSTQCFQGYVRYGMFGIEYAPQYAGGSCSANTLPNLTGVLGTRPQYRTQHSGKVRYELDTGTRHFGKFCTTLVPVPDTSLSSVRPQSGTRHFGTGIILRT